MTASFMVAPWGGFLAPRRLPAGAALLANAGSELTGE
jgi:hypothetical protein